MDPLDLLISNKLKRIGAAKQVRAAIVLDIVTARLRDHFGDELAMMMRPATLKKGVITIRCTNSSCAQEIALNERDLLEKINAALGSESAVTRLRATS